MIATKMSRLIYSSFMRVLSPFAIAELARALAIDQFLAFLFLAGPNRRGSKTSYPHAAPDFMKMRETMRLPLFEGLRAKLIVVATK